MALLERDSLLDELDARRAAAASGQGSMVLLAGEAGAGKTSVVRELVRRTGSRVLALWGGCDPLTTPRPLSPLLDVIADPDSGLVELAGEDPERFALFAALLERLRVTARPIVLVVGGCSLGRRRNPQFSSLPRATGRIHKGSGHLYLPRRRSWSRSPSSVGAG